MFFLCRYLLRVWDPLLLKLLIYVITVSLYKAHARVLPFVWKPTNKVEYSIINRLPSIDRNTAGINQFGYIEILPNGTLIVQNKMENSTNFNQFLILKSINGATKVNPSQSSSNIKLNIKIYGEGTEHKLPPFLERIIQRIQTYFSVYKYTDTSAVESFISNEENINLQITVQPTLNNVPVTSTPSLSANTLMDNINNTSADMSIHTDTKLQNESPSFIDIESTTQEGSAEYTEFIETDEHDDDFIIIGED